MVAMTVLEKDTKSVKITILPDSTRFGILHKNGHCDQANALIYMQFEQECPGERHNSQY